MLASKAIEYLEELYKGLSEEMVSTYGVAIKLSIEALKFYSELKRTQGVKIAFNLPGETEEK